MKSKGLVRGGTARLRVVAGLVAAIAALALPSAAAAAFTGPVTLTFSDFPEGTKVATQYDPVGVVFSGEYGEEPEILWDRSSLTNPVLSGPFGFGSMIRAAFVTPGTFIPATVENLAMDVGYINEPGSTVVTIETTNGPVPIDADEYGFNHIALTANDITGFTVESVEGEPAGWGVDNLAYVVPTPPPPSLPVTAPPPAPTCPTYEVFDSRGSGEPLGSTSKPGKKFIPAFEQRLISSHEPSTVSVHDNPYPAVGVVGNWRDNLNGLGAVFGVHDLGAYRDSESEGRKEVLSFVKTEIAGACGSTSKIVLLGYSQGAQATGDAYEQLSPDQRRHVAAVVLWGDPRYNHKDALADRDDRGTDGLLGTRKPFPNDAKHQNESKIFSYCNNRDIICQTFPLAEIAYFRAREHELYYTTDEAKNDGSAVASFLARQP
ncbi:MAG TPA: cutinase family protein [Solirubrobacterales bacterium]|jgi:hypothetical protein|nr:cutinase family protein [Solirubrobacterales bacterium]